MFLADTHIAGLLGADADTLKLIRAGMPLRVVREGNNEHDEFAVALHTESGVRVGYLPRSINQIPARLLDAGRSFTATVTSVQTYGTRLVAMINLFLVEPSTTAEAA